MASHTHHDQYRHHLPVASRRACRAAQAYEPKPVVKLAMRPLGWFFAGNVIMTTDSVDTTTARRLRRFSP